VIGPSLAFAVALPLVQEPPASEVPPLELRVNDAIARAVAWLRGEQRQDGSFPGYENEHPGGPTALAVFALVKSGVRRDDPALVRAVRSLDGKPMKSIYSAGVHLLMCEALGSSPERRDDAQASLDFIVSNQSQGAWAYPWGHLCSSNTQFALMGMRAASLLGLDVPEGTRAEAAEAIWMFQDRSGAGLYEPSGRAYASVTAALLANCALLADMSADSESVQRALKRHEKDRQAAEGWLAERFDLTRNVYANGSWTPGWHTSYLWAVERWCGLTQQTRFADLDWYREGAAWLVDTQAENGSWPTNDRPLENTCMALAFLRKATVSTGGELPEPGSGASKVAAAPRPPDRPSAEARRLTDWWLSGPWQGGDDGQILLEPPFDPAAIEPRAPGKLAKRAWERVALKSDGWTDLGALTQRDGDWQLWCLSTTLAYAPAEAEGAAELLLWLELEDGWDVWLDGKRVSHDRRVGAAINGDVKIPLELAPGQHRLTVLVEDVGGAAAFGARLSSATNAGPPATLTSWAEPPSKRGALQRK
jgi:hypothetical protein